MCAFECVQSERERDKICFKQVLPLISQRTLHNVYNTVRNWRESFTYDTYESISTKCRQE